MYDNTNRGVLFNNDRKANANHPDFKGSLNVDGKEFWVSAWNKQGSKGSFISFSIEEKKDANQTQNSKKTQFDESEVPF